MNKIKYIRLQVEESSGLQHVIVEFVNGSRVCSCGMVRGNPPDLRFEDIVCG